jgi:hypothetical protein
MMDTAVGLLRARFQQIVKFSIAPNEFLNREHKQFLRVASKPKKNAATWRVRLSTTMESEPTTIRNYERDIRVNARRSNSSIVSGVASCDLRRRDRFSFAFVFMPCQRFVITTSPPGRLSRRALSDLTTLEFEIKIRLE